MTEIAITSMGSDRFGVEITEGTTTTGHVVTVPGPLLDDLGMTDIDPELIVRESIGFLLEREPAANVLREFSLDDIPRYFEGFYDELRTRIGA